MPAGDGHACSDQGACLAGCLARLVRINADHRPQLSDWRITVDDICLEVLDGTKAGAWICRFVIQQRLGVGRRGRVQGRRRDVRGSQQCASPPQQCPLCQPNCLAGRAMMPQVCSGPVAELCAIRACPAAADGLPICGAEGGAATADQSAFVSSTHRPAAGIYSQKSKKVRGLLMIMDSALARHACM